MRRLFPMLCLAAALPLVGCAYWNTFYLAKKNYDKATNGEPYVLDPATMTSAQYFTKSISYSKKLIAQFPKSKWVDDAYLLWARSLLGRDDPLETANMLNEFTTRYPKSPILADATFYLGVADRRAHRPDDGLRALDEFLARYPRHAMVSYALLERSLTLQALGRRAEAADAAGMLIERYPNSALVRPALIARSDALLADGQFERAREDFKTLGRDALDDEQRLRFLLREADCLEGARQYDSEIDLLHGALSHEIAPVISNPAGGTDAAAPDNGGGATVVSVVAGQNAANPGAPVGAGGIAGQHAADRWGRLRLRVGTAHLMAGRLDAALKEYHEVALSYPRSPLAAEAQYRVGYAYETEAADFDRARLEYAKVKDQSAIGGFVKEASQRTANIDRFSNLRKSMGRDSLERKAQAAFMLAELYLFQHDHPDRAIEQYRQIQSDFRGTGWAGKALNAEAWVLKNKMSRPGEADSLFWVVIRNYKATEAQLAARDYLEAEGHEVPESLIVRPAVVVDTSRAIADTLRLTPPPALAPRLGIPGVAGAAGAPSDTTLKLGSASAMRRGMFAPGSGDSAVLVYPHRPAPQRADSLVGPLPPRPDTLARASAADSLRSAVPADTSKRRP